MQWFNEASYCKITPTTKELFGIIHSSKKPDIFNKFNSTTQPLRHYICSSRINREVKNKDMHEFITYFLNTIWKIKIKILINEKDSSDIGLVTKLSILPHVDQLCNI